MSIFFNDDFAAHNDLLPGRWSGDNISRSIVGGIGSMVCDLDPRTEASFATTDYATSSGFTILIVSGINGFSTEIGGLLFNLVDSGATTYDVGYLNSGNITFTDHASQTNIGIGYLDGYNITDLYVEGVSLTITWTRIDDDTSHFVCSFYTDDTLTTLIATSENDVPAGILTGFFSMTIENPIGDSTAFVVQRVSMYTPGGACFAHGSLIETDEGLVPIEKLSSGTKIVDYKGETSTVVKVWKSILPREEQCYSFKNVMVTGKHSIQKSGSWVKVSELELKSTRIGGHFYQIESTSFGINTSHEIFSTWTVSHVKSNLSEIKSDME
jgi:hypothetical protein